MTEPLEEINEDTCVSKFAAMRSDTPGYLDQCRSCQGTYYTQCDKYRAIGKHHSFFKLGIDKLRQFYQQRISINSLPHEDNPQ
jgi:hypothetical protein